MFLNGAKFTSHTLCLSQSLMPANNSIFKRNLNHEISVFFSSKLLIDLINILTDSKNICAQNQYRLVKLAQVSYSISNTYETH